MVDQKLVDYIKEQLNSGHSVDEIRGHLLGYGYKYEDIEQAVNEAKEAKVPPPPSEDSSPTKPTKERELKRVGVLSLGKMFALIGLIIGLIKGIIIMLLSFLPDLVTSIYDIFGLESLNTLTTPILDIGILSIVVFPVISVICGFISGCVVAFVYNIFAGKIGGIKINVE
jgi:energy-converting hydrogenase Eha subunit A